MRTLSLSGLVILLLGIGLSRPGGGEDAGRTMYGPLGTVQDDTLSAYTETIPGTLVEFKMVPVPAGSVTVEGPEGVRQKAVGPFWISATEVRWGAYDTYRLDKKKEGLTSEEFDAISLPSKPYGFGSEIPGFGKKKYPVLSVTRNAAQEYAHWLSAKTDRAYRLPTPAEWKHTCRLGHGTPKTWSEEKLRKWAWYRANAEGKAHPVGGLNPSDLGVYDQLGNAAELVAPWSEEAEHPPEVWGGSYQSTAEEVHCTARRRKTPEWQESDPQLPKSKWWLSDAQFVGFRVVRAP